jgi:hypothetical protein
MKKPTTSPVQQIALSGGQIHILDNLSQHQQRLFAEIQKVNELIEDFSRTCIRSYGLSPTTHVVDREGKCIKAIK